MGTPPLQCDVCGTANPQQAKFCFSCGTSLHDSSYPRSTTKATSSHSSPHSDMENLRSNHLLKQRYRICSLVGQGGMGAVYQAEDIQFGNRFMAVKEMRLGALNFEEVSQAISSFQSEALLLAGLMHPNIPRIFDHFSEDGRWYLLMDFIDGPTLEEYLNKSPRGYLPIEEVIDIGLQLCTALDYLHTRQLPIIFRDLKPANIIRTSNGQIFLIDFGIARHFKPGQLKDTIPFGSVGYAAPEQYGRVQTSPRADIYSLGVTFHQLLSGHNPTLTPFRFAPLLRLDQPVPAELEALIMHMVDLDESNRPASVAVIQQELQRFTARQTTAHIETVQLELKAGLPPSLATRRLPPMGTTLVTYHGHQARVLGLAWSPDGRYIASASADRTVQIWDAVTGNNMMSYHGHTAWVKAVVWSPDGRYIASAGADTTVHIWNVLTGRTMLLYRGHTNIVTALAWSFNSQYIASCGYDRTIQVWDAVRGDEFGVYHGHSPLAMINAVAWSPDSCCIVSAGDDKTVQIWPIEQIRGVLLQEERQARKKSLIYSGHTGWVKTVAWSPNGKRIASGSWDNTVHLWDSTNRRFVYIHSDHSSWINSVAWSPNGTRIASASNDGTVHVWDANTGRELFTNRAYFTYEGHRDDVKAVAWSPDGTRIASGSYDTTVQVWDAG